MCQWIDLYGSTNMTNYIHMLGSGHLSYFAERYGNLYRFSQQGCGTESVVEAFLLQQHKSRRLLARELMALIVTQL
jgi:hypothetical protein